MSTEIPNSEDGIQPNQMTPEVVDDEFERRMEVSKQRIQRLMIFSWFANLLLVVYLVIIGSSLDDILIAFIEFNLIIISFVLLLLPIQPDDLITRIWSKVRYLFPVLAVFAIILSTL